MGLKLTQTNSAGHDSEYHIPVNISITKDAKTNTYRLRQSYARYKDQAEREDDCRSDGGNDVTNELTQEEFNAVITAIKGFEKAKQTGSPLAGATDVVD